MIERATLLSSIFFGFLALAPAASSAQAPGPNVVDRLVAVVGDSVIVQTQVVEEIQRLGLQGMQVPDEGTPAYTELFRQVLDEYVNRLLVLQAAAKDSLIEVDESAIDQTVNDQINELARQMGGQPALQQALAAESLTLGEYREIMRNETRMQQIARLFYQLRLRNAAPALVTEEEMLARFQEARGTMQQRPKTLTFHQVVVTPQADDAAREAAREKAEALLDSINAGRDFAELARAHSDDPGTAELGGDLGWFRRGRMVREFENAAFALFDGEVSGVVETEYGFHIIKVERSRAGERSARHILVSPESTPADIEAARQRANQVLERARAGESMNVLFEEYSDPAAPDSMTVAFDQISRLPPVYSALSTATTGQVLGPLEYEGAPGETHFAVVRVDEVREAGAFTFEDLRPQIAAQLQQDKQRERLLAELRARTHIEIHM
jgi:peptidyl-prolyl cis-trans isomerase SurA